MKNSVIVKFVLPFLQWFLLMILIAIFIDYLFHRLQIISIGRYLGYAGTFLIAVSFIYSLRKRKIIESGSPKNLLMLHEYLAWAGSIMILIHSGIHFNALLPWLAVLMLLNAVASGLVGKFLLKRANETLKEKMTELLNSGMQRSDAEKKLFMDSIAVDMMKKWRVVHLPITIILGVLSFLHILSIIIFSS